MDTIENKSDSIELKLSPTSLTLKRGTKKLLDSLGSKRESYDEIIRKIIQENKNLKSEVEKWIPMQTNGQNKLYISSIKRSSSSYILGNKKIFFEHNVFQKPAAFFRFDIHYTKILVDDEKKDINDYTSPLGMAKDYLLIYGKLLKTYMDPLFKLDHRRIFDLDWWRQRMDSLGLSNETYKSEIEEKLIRFGVLP